ncbi:MAG: hypothetical protein IJ757_05525 [Clostridiales bacterium]|nr:hypothetical protein [Clostridiales bacterium]
MSYRDLLPELRAFYALISFITFIISVTDIVRTTGTFKKKHLIFVPILTTLMSCLMFQTFSYFLEINGTNYDIHSVLEDMISIRLINMPAIIAGLLTFVPLAISIVSYVATTRKINTSITLRSIRDGFNNLDTGILMYRDGGFILFANTVMQQIAVDLTGKRVTNGEQLKKALSTPDNHIVLENGEVYLIKENILDVDGKKVNELTATDVTILTRLRREENKLNQQKEAFNRRMSEYSRKVGEVTVSKEILDTKIDVHETFGNALLMTKAYIRKDKNASELNTLKQMWRKTLVFKEIPSDPSEDRFSLELYQAAKACGIDLTIDGMLPPYKDAQIRKILSAAAREAIINASRHASADKMDLKIESTDDKTEFTFSNNGKIPEGITEGGGLSSLRKLIETNSGTMKLTAEPEFKLIISIPVRNGSEGEHAE